MELLKSSIKSWWQKTRAFALSFLRLIRKKPLDQEEIDKKLVYSLSTRKVPSREQLRHLKKFLNPREFFIVKLCALVVLVGAIYFGLIFVRNHIESSPAAGGTYSEGLIGYPRSVNPLYALSRDVDADLSRLVYSSLFQHDEAGRLAPDLAESLEISSDHKEYLIRIKDGVRFHNGERLTVDDIIFTVETIQNPDFHSPLRSSLSLAVVEKVDDLTVKFKLNEPFSPFLDFLTFGIMPKRLWESVTPDGALLSDLNLKPIGSGPYRFKSLVRSSAGDMKEYSLEANRDYYGEVPYLTNFNFKFYPNYEEAIKALNAKQVLGISYLPFGWRSELLAQNSLNFLEMSQPRLVSLFFNQAKNTALASKDNRVALAAAINKEELIANVFGGLYQPADSPILPSSWAYSEVITRYGYDPESARGKLSVGPFTAVLTVVDTGLNTVVAAEIQHYLEEAGARITIKVISGEQAADIIKNRDFEMLLYGQSLGGDPDVYAFWHSSQAGASGLNLSNYSSAEADKMLVGARATTNEAERLARYQKFQEIVTADLPAIFLFSPTYTYVQGNKLQGVSTHSLIRPADRFSGVSHWYLKTDRRLSW